MGGSVKVAVAIVIALISVGVLVMVFFAGMWLGLCRNYDNRLRDLGLTRQSAVQFAGAVKILMRLHQKTDLEGLAAGDRLSPETKAMVDKWATAYRIGISKQ